MLAFANVRTHWRSFLAAMVATTFGAALISATLIVYDSSRPALSVDIRCGAVEIRPDRRPDFAGFHSRRSGLGKPRVGDRKFHSVGNAGR